VSVVRKARTLGRGAGSDLQWRRKSQRVAPWWRSSSNMPCMPGKPFASNKGRHVSGRTQGNRHLVWQGVAEDTSEERRDRLADDPPVRIPARDIDRALRVSVSHQRGAQPKVYVSEIGHVPADDARASSRTAARAPSACAGR
jgi:hypothetical protein